VSKAQLVITAVLLEGRTQADVARAYGVSKSWISKLVARYHQHGEAAFVPRSRRPHHSPQRLPDDLIERIATLRNDLTTQGLDAGPTTIAWHLATHHDTRVAPATISRHLTRLGLVEPQPKKRPRSSYIRFQAAMPNQTWQSDITHVRLTTGTEAKILTWLDDCSRYALSVTAHTHITAHTVLTTFRHTIATHGTPASTLTDNGMVYTTRFAGGRGGRSALESELRRLNVTQKNARPNHPTTCGKVERFQQTLKNWLHAQTTHPGTLEALQAQLDAFKTTYNHHRPHRSLPHHATPASIYTTHPKASPTSGREHDTHDRVRSDTIDKAGVVTLRVNGRLHHIGVGRQHAHQRVILLVQDLDIRIVDTTTGELLRHLTLDPTRDYQPTGQPKGPKPKTKRTKP
jgi:transposase InsO family protein